jgi:hypothetical protein
VSHGVGTRREAFLGGPHARVSGRWRPTWWSTQCWATAWAAHPHGVAAELIRWMSSRTAPVVSLGVPSGVDSTTGTAPGAYVRATTTMTLAFPKTGLDADPVGELWLADIGIPREVYRRVGVQLPDGLFTPGYRVRLAGDADDRAQTRVPLQ